MSNKTNRNLLAAIMIVVGAVLVAVSPVSADGEAVPCTDFSYDFDSLGQGPLTKNQTTLGPVSVSIPAGTYDIILTSSDPTHAPGAFTDQLHESWFLVTNSGFTSPVTPDIADADTSLAISINGIALGATTQITAVWAGQAPSFDSVHAAVTFRCVVVPSTTTTAAPTTTMATTTTLGETTTSTSILDNSTTTSAPVTTQAPATTQAPTTTTSDGVGGLGSTTTVADPTPTTAVGQTDSDGEDAEVDELAYTGIKLNLAVAGVSLIAAGIGLVVVGAHFDRRKLAVIEAR